MNNLIGYFDNFDDSEFEPDDYNYEKHMKQMGNALHHRKMTDIQVAIYVGLRLLDIKEKVRHGELLITYEKLGIGVRTAQNCMLLARKYKVDKTIVESLTIEKAIAPTRMDEEDFVQFKRDELLKMPNGEYSTWGEVKDIATKDSENKRINDINKKNAELRDANDRISNLEAENKTMKVDDEKNKKILEESLTGDSKTLYEENQAIKKSMAELHERMDELEIELHDKRQKKANEEEGLEVLRKAKEDITNIFITFASINMKPETHLASEYFGFITWAEREITLLRRREASDDF